VGGYLLSFLLKRRWQLLLETGLISLGPFALLQFVLWLTFGQLGLRSGGEGATSFSLIPFGGLLAFGLDNPQTLLIVILILGPLILWPCLALSISLVRSFRQAQVSPAALILTLHLILMATLPFSTYVDLPGVLRLTSGLVVATVVYGALMRSRKLLNYSALWLLSLAYLYFFV
jgi:hypothetical protein